MTDELALSGPPSLGRDDGAVISGGTRFFRDGEVWDTLSAEVLPTLSRGRTASREIRVWVPGCASGEEAYSMAVACTEALGEGPQPPRIRIFATDIDRAAIDRARGGVYPETISDDVSPQRLERFFIPGEGGYQIARRIRDMVVFAVHDLAQDPPLARLDLVSCRNLLIYLTPERQDRALRVLHYGLLPGGYLVLGALETTAELHHRFSTVDAKLSIYAKRQPADVAKRPVPSSIPVLASGSTAGMAPGAIGEGQPSLLSSKERRLLQLQRELGDARRRLRTTFEDLECANEELQSMVEELRSSNEELEGTNEELEREKEDLQAATEELVGVNDELQARIVELRLANDDIHNLLDVTGNAVVIVGMDGRIRRLNDTARRLLKLESRDVAVPLSRVTQPLGPEQLQRIVGHVVQSLVPFDGPVTGADGRSYALRVVPYKTAERAIRGAVISLAKTEAPLRITGPSRLEVT